WAVPVVQEPMCWGACKLLKRKERIWGRDEAQEELILDSGQVKYQAKIKRRLKSKAMSQQKGVAGGLQRMEPRDFGAFKLRGQAECHSGKTVADIEPLAFHQRRPVHKPLISGTVHVRR